MSVVQLSSPPPPPPLLPPAVTVTGASPRPRLPSNAPHHPGLPHAQSDYALDISRPGSSSSSSSSFQNQRPGILRSVSLGDSLYAATSPLTPTAGVQFAPLPQIAPRKRKSTRSLGLAARSQMLKAQAERRSARQEQDLAWEDLAQLMKDASKLLKRVVGKGPKNKSSADAEQEQEETTVQELLIQQHAAHMREKPLPTLDERPRSPPPLMPYLTDDDQDQDDSGDAAEFRDSGFSEDVDDDQRSSLPDDDPTPTEESAPDAPHAHHHDGSPPSATAISAAL